MRATNAKHKPLKGLTLLTGPSRTLILSLSDFPSCTSLKTYYFYLTDRRRVVSVTDLFARDTQWNYFLPRVRARLFLTVCTWWVYENRWSGFILNESSYALRSYVNYIHKINAIKNQYYFMESLLNGQYDI